MVDTMNEDLQHTETNGRSDENTVEEAPGRGDAEEPQTTPGGLREASYVVLFIGAVFVVNAMETGSYRTPWPVALLAALTGLGLFGYSWYLQYRSKAKK